VSLLASTFGAIAEASWIAVFGAAAVALVGTPGPAGVLAPCVVAALCGLTAARLLPNGLIRVPALLAVTVGAVGAGVWFGPGWLTNAAAQPWPLYLLLGLAVLRGAVQGDPSAGVAPIERLVRISPVLLGTGWLIGLRVADATRDTFVGEATAATIAFVLAATLAIGLARLAAVDMAHGQFGGNGPWLLSLGGLLAGALLVMLPLWSVLGGSLGALARGVGQVVATVVVTPLAAIVGLVMLVAGAIAGLLRSVLPVSTLLPPPPPPEGVPQGPDASSGAEPSPLLDSLLGLGLLIVLLVVAWLLVRRWQGERYGPARPAGVPEERSIRVVPVLPLPTLRLRRRTPSWSSPDGALAAYPRLLQEWASHPEVARAPDESPAAHAARLRASRHGSLALDLLAADYQLARFGEVQLTASEDRRAVARWRLLRARERPG
jgi:hypothetical protein